MAKHTVEVTVDLSDYHNEIVKYVKDYFNMSEIIEIVDAHRFAHRLKPDDIFTVDELLSSISEDDMIQYLVDNTAMGDALK
jgi:hypothetical protein